MPSALDMIGNNKALQDHWVKRFIAALIDGLLLFIPLYIIFNVVLWGFLWSSGLWWLFGGWWFLYPLFFFLYFVLLEGTQGATLGKKMVNLQVQTIDGQKPEMSSVAIRNLSRFFGLVVLDWLIGFIMEGDPRQKFLDRYANVVVVRTDEHAYQEEQFKQMAHIPPHPTVPAQPQQQWGQPPPQPQQQAPPQQWPAPQQQGPPPAQQGWPGQQQQAPAGSGWPQHEPGEPPKRFCQSCGGTLNPRGDGRLACVRCGAVY